MINAIVVLKVNRELISIFIFYTVTKSNTRTFHRCDMKTHMHRCLSAHNVLFTALRRAYIDDDLDMPMG